jgi:hypothetical protein
VNASRIAALVAVLTAGVAQAAADTIRIGLSPTATNSPVTSSLAAKLKLPGQCDVFLHAPTGAWLRTGQLEFDLTVPADGPTNAQVLVYVVDWDYRWYQTLLQGRVEPGRTQRWSVDLTPTAAGWETQGHHMPWQLRTLCAPIAVAVRVFGAGPYTGTCRIERVFGQPRPEPRDPPAIRNVRASPARVRCFERFEVALSLPDRYPNPFDPDQVSVRAVFECPTGMPVTVDGFYAQDFYRTLGPTGEATEPQGMPVWRVRFTPTIVGSYRYRLLVTDRTGTSEWGPGSFESLPAKLPGFVRVSRRDPRFFEFDNGKFYFPIGHNIRSPFDVRTDEQFPWKQRWPEGSAAYLRYFKEMNKHQANFAELWSAAWSLGLEWHPLWKGYHGLGQYNLRNAWEMDQVVESAERLGIYLNVVIHNHGKYSLSTDQEWRHNPMNVEQGGYLKHPNEFFTSERALRDYRNLMRYMIARWGGSPAVFAWELWSELNLVGDHGVHRTPECIEWHRTAGRMIKDMDPYDHLITTHYSGDYHVQTPEISQLPEMDHCAVDAYHGSPLALHIVTLIRETADYNNAFGKPVLITEFGGSSRAHQGFRHLSYSHHAALWASACSSIAGTPCFWWWMLIDEENFYPRYAAVSRFLRGEDPRNPDARMLGTAPSTNATNRCTVAIQGGTPPNTLGVVAYGAPAGVNGWIHRDSDYEAADPAGLSHVTNAVLQLGGMTDGRFVVEYWDTLRGEPVQEYPATAAGGVLRIDVPPFARDIAFKAKSEP